MSIQSVRTTGQLATVDQLTVSVTNHSDRSVRPSFTIEDGMSMTAFWRRVHGPPVLGPHQKASYTIQAPSYFAMPSIANGFQVLAFSHAPATVSRTGAYVASVWRRGAAALRHQPAGRPGPARSPCTPRSSTGFDQPVRVANLPVYLGQVIYAQGGTDTARPSSTRDTAARHRSQP